jgi:16S rRNA (guanine527-N7)-methyltransferase
MDSRDRVSKERKAELLAPYADGVPEGLLAQLELYLDLLLRWNARTNLTAIREPEQIVTRHFGESLFAGQALSAYLTQGATLLDLGSGAGFPGVPIQLLRPDLQVTLAESQNKKSAFLHEVVRQLGLSTAVHAGRAEALTRTFDCVTLRAVDNMPSALAAAVPRLSAGGVLAVFTTGEDEPPSSLPLLVAHDVPKLTHSQLVLYRAPACST